LRLAVQRRYITRPKGKRGLPGSAIRAYKTPTAVLAPRSAPPIADGQAAEP